GIEVARDRLDRLAGAVNERINLGNLGEREWLSRFGGFQHLRPRLALARVPAARWLGELAWGRPHVGNALSGQPQQRPRHKANSRHPRSPTPNHTPPPRARGCRAPAAKARTPQPPRTAEPPPNNDAAHCGHSCGLLRLCACTLRAPQSCRKAVRKGAPHLVAR